MNEQKVLNSFSCTGGTSRVCYLDNEDVLPASKPVMRDTGDLVEISQRGLIHLGRHDDQIKRHGKRITLTQIQQVTIVNESGSNWEIKNKINYQSKTNAI